MLLGEQRKKIVNNVKLFNTEVGEDSSAPQNGESNPVCSLPLKKRNRLSADEKRAKRKAVADDYRAGHPSLAIMLRQGLSKLQHSTMLTDLFEKGELTPTTSRYEVVPVSTPIKALSQFAENNAEYIRVVHDDHGTTLTPYIKEIDNEHNQ